MGEMDAGRIPKLVPLTEAVSVEEMREGLPAAVDAGDVVLYIRTPAGKEVYVEGVQRKATEMNPLDVFSRSLSPFDRARARDASRAGIPVICHPKPVPGAVFLGLSAKDAKILLELESADIHWFPYAVLSSPRSVADPQPLERIAPWRSPCCLRPDDGHPKRGPWIGHDDEHALQVSLQDVFVEPCAAKRSARRPPAFSSGRV